MSMSEESNNCCDLESPLKEMSEIRDKTIDSTEIKKLSSLLSDIVTTNAILLSSGKISSEEYGYRLGQLEKLIGRSGIVDKLIEHRSLLDWIRL